MHLNDTTFDSTTVYVEKNMRLVCFTFLGNLPQEALLKLCPRPISCIDDEYVQHVF